ncbi:hypothetical protein BRADI_3g18912v3 [Brachypodium distachyon]|uniref:Uncharacterized protein n=1 Tax=Brachypodium distachyon TaxID=15368 RepID=A0A0Q3HQJ9_BRADI|nr:hypothetical protein BRADI_3g18912v3 [Brachypodium distachyon]
MPPTHPKRRRLPPRIRSAPPSILRVPPRPPRRSPGLAAFLSLPAAFPAAPLNPPAAGGASPPTRVLLVRPAVLPTRTRSSPSEQVEEIQYGVPPAVERWREREKIRMQRCNGEEK